MSYKSSRFKSITAINRAIMSKSSFTMEEAKELFSSLFPEMDDDMIKEYLKSYGREIVNSKKRKNDQSHHDTKNDRPTGEDIGIDIDEMDIDDLLEIDLKVNSANFSDDLNDKSEIITYRDNSQLLEVYKTSQNKEILGELVIANKPLVLKFARAYSHYLNHKLDFEDLISAGYLGLMKAAKKYNFDYGNEFSTYATFWIKQSISRMVMDEGFTIRIPVHVFEKISKITRLEKEMDRDYNKIDKELICSEMGITKSQYDYYKVLQSQIIDLVSLNMNINHDGNDELGEFFNPEANHLFLSVNQVLNPVEELLKKDLTNSINQALDNLKKRQGDILRLRFGLTDGRNRTLEEIGEIYGVTRERIRQIESTAINKLRENRTLKDYLLN